MSLPESAGGKVSFLGKVSFPGRPRDGQKIFVPGQAERAGRKVSLPGSQRDGQKSFVPGRQLLHAGLFTKESVIVASRLNIPL